MRLGIIEKVHYWVKYFTQNLIKAAFSLAWMNLLRSRQIRDSASSLYIEASVAD
ncbi:hypothetical protein SX4_0749 [Vibrio mimicus SX-4]|nr:hypothetical protein SX4_0749 [Vibrio mimicus SX-4]